MGRFNPVKAVTQVVTAPVQSAVNVLPTPVKKKVESVVQPKRKPNPQPQQAQPQMPMLTGDSPSAGSSDQFNVDSLVDKYKTAREGGMAKGLEFGQQYFGGGKTPEELNKITGSLLGMYQDQATKGINSPAFQAMRNTALQGINQQGMMAMRDLQAQQGASGMRGAAAMAQKQNMLQSQQQQRGQLENQLLLQDMAARERGQANLQQLVGGQQAGLMGAQLGFGGLAAQDLSSAQQQILAQKYLGQGDIDVAAAERPVQETYPQQVMSHWGDVWDKLGWLKFQGGYDWGGKK